MKDIVLKLYKSPAVRRAFLALVLAILAALGVDLSAGCAAAPGLPGPRRALCYAQADGAAQSRVDAECRIGDAGVDFAECPAHDEILDQLQRDQESCE